MNLLRFRQAVAIATAFLLIPSVPAQEAGDKVDLATLAQIKQEAFDHSQVMENLYYISEVYGPRVNNSRNHRAAAEWAVAQIEDDLDPEHQQALARAKAAIKTAKGE